MYHITCFEFYLVTKHLLSVLALYAQGGGKTANHAWQADSRSIGAISYLAMQVYEFAFHQQFRSVHARNRGLQVPSFAHVLSDMFLYLFSPDSCTLSADRRTLTLNEHSLETFSRLSSEITRVASAVKVLRASRRNKKSLNDELE